MHHSIKSLQKNSANFCGSALTCFSYPADNLAVMGALHLSEPGDVIVCAKDAFEATTVIGDLVCGMMTNKGVTVVPFSRIDEEITKLDSLTAAEAAFEARIKYGLVEPDYKEELMSSSKTLYVG